MIADPAEIALVQSKRRTCMWLPVLRGSMGQRRACPVEVETCVRLAPRPFVKGTAVTITAVLLRAFEPLTPADVKALGYFSPEAVRAAWRRFYGRATASTEVWAVSFVLGDHADFYAGHRESYLRAKMGGARPYTEDPARAIGGASRAWAHSVPQPDQLAAAEKTRAEREKHNRAVLARALSEVQGELHAIARLETKAARERRRYLNRRKGQIKAAMSGVA